MNTERLYTIFYANTAELAKTTEQKEWKYKVAKPSRIFSKPRSRRVLSYSYGELARQL